MLKLMEKFLDEDEAYAVAVDDRQSYLNAVARCHSPQNEGVLQNRQMERATKLVVDQLAVTYGLRSMWGAYCRLDKETSCGPFFSSMGFKFKKDLPDDVVMMVASTFWGVRELRDDPLLVFGYNLKDELLPRQKVVEKRTRAVIAAPVIVQVLMGQFGAFNERLNRKFNLDEGELGVGAGYVEQYGGFNDLVALFDDFVVSRGAPGVVHGDMRHFDEGVGHMIMFALQVRMASLETQLEKKLFCDVYLWIMTHVLVKFRDGTVAWLTIRQISGQPGTMHDNGIILHIVHVYAYLVLVGRDDFYDFVILMVMGDDHMWASAEPLYVAAGVRDVISRDVGFAYHELTSPCPADQLEFMSATPRWDNELKMFLPKRDVRKYLCKLTYSRLDLTLSEYQCMVEALCLQVYLCSGEFGWELYQLVFRERGWAPREKSTFLRAYIARQ